MGNGRLLCLLQPLTAQRLRDCMTRKLPPKPSDNDCSTGTQLQNCCSNPQGASWMIPSNIPSSNLSLSTQPRLLNIVSRIRSPPFPHLRSRHHLLDLRYGNKLFDPHDLTRGGRIDGLEDSRHSFPQTQGVEHTLRLLGQANGGAYEGDFEKGHGFE